MTILQAKHYLKTAFPKFLQVLREEEPPKIKRFAPQRYLLTTSQELTPDRKTSCLTSLLPYVSIASDIFGREDLNNLLGKHPEIER